MSETVSVCVHMCVFLKVYTMFMCGHACSVCLWLIYSQMEVSVRVCVCVCVVNAMVLMKYAYVV